MNSNALYGKKKLFFDGSFSLNLLPPQKKLL